MRVEYENGTGLLAVIGDPIAHSLSPLLQNTMIKALERDDLYLAFRVEKGGLPKFLSASETLGIDGFNLTMPHKEDILPFLDDISPEARRCGSVNTVRRRSGRLEGHSTDGLGFRQSLLELGLDFPGQNVTILGAGGASRSIAMTAADSGAARVTVVNRTLSRAEAICRGAAQMEALELSRVEEAMPDTDILINTTPLGMEGVAGEGQYAFLTALKPGAAAVDCIYAPAVTPFMTAAQALGHPTQNGIGMLVYQAVYAYEFFRELHFSRQTVEQLGALLLGACQKK